MFPQDMDLKALGFDVAEGVNDPYLPGDCGIVVTKVDKGSLAEGRLRWMVHCVFTLVNSRIAELISSIKCLFLEYLNNKFFSCFFLCRVNDWLLKINDVDLTNKDRKQVIKAVLSGEGVINMVVRRRKSIGGRIIAPVQINLTGNKGPNSPAA